VRGANAALSAATVQSVGPKEPHALPEFSPL